MPPFPSAKGREEAIDEGAHFGRWVCSWTRPLWPSTWNVAHVTLQPPLSQGSRYAVLSRFSFTCISSLSPIFLASLANFLETESFPRPNPLSIIYWPLTGGSGRLFPPRLLPCLPFHLLAWTKHLRPSTREDRTSPTPSPLSRNEEAADHVANQGCSYFTARSPTRLCLPHSQPTLTSSRTSVLSSHFPLYLIFSPHSPGTQHLGEGPNILTLQILSPSTLKAFSFTYPNYSAARRWNTERFFIHINISVRSVLETWFCHLLVIWFAAKFNFLSEKWVW